MAYDFSVEERIDTLTSFPANTILFATFIFAFLYVYVITREKKRAFRVFISLMSALAYSTILLLVVAYATSGVRGGI
ncbi:hypothetical protein KGK29_004563 [Salmonella enterica]|nr:hypothetical protein [Salmonella enterica]